VVPHSDGNSLTNSFHHKLRLGFASVFIALLLVSGVGARPEIVVIYPNEGQTLPTIRNEFIHGHIADIPNGATCSLTINDQTVTVHSGGGFLAWLPVTSGPFSFELSARFFSPASSDKGKAAVKKRELEPLYLVRNVIVTPPAKTIPSDSLVVVGDFGPPLGNISMGTGERLDIRMRATPGCIAWATLEGVNDSIPMAEIPAQKMNYAGEGIFSRAVASEGYEVAGIYAAFVDIDRVMRCDTTRLRYFVTPKHSNSDEAHRSLLDFARGRPTQMAEKASGYAITINGIQFPRLVRLKDSVQTLRVGPRQGYQMILQPKGIELLAVGSEGNWIQVELCPGQTAWVNDTSIEEVAVGAAPQRSEIGAVRMVSTDSIVTFQFQLHNKHPFLITEDDRRTLSIDLFGVESNLDWIRYVATDSLVDFASWSQPERERFRLTIRLAKDLWGYECEYVGNVFQLHIVRPPRNLHSLSGKRIVIDPGHSKEPGARGPTGFTEAQANLGISLKLKRRLEVRGATVQMTRSDDSDVPLNDRPAIASKYGADLFVSVHNNSCPDGVNPWENNGTSVFYYHPHSIDLARSIQTELVKATGLKDHGVYHGNLAVARATGYPAVLVECAFMIIPEQEARLRTDAFQSTVAEAIASGVEGFLKGANRGR
jgi:N-acetylmuramoyl-L-alanine amidase